jgi:dCTP deaminase
LILTDREIQIAIERELIRIDPRPTEKAFSSTSVDLTLDPSLTRFRNQRAGVETVIDPNHVDFSPESSLAELTEVIEIPADGFPLPCKTLFLAWTYEYVDLKTDARLAARVEGKSSLARLGLGVHITAPTIHSGFNGRIRLEMINHGSLPIKLRPGMRICQLIFETTFGTPERGYKGQFSGQTAPPAKRK